VIIELGHFALILALAAAVVQGTLPMIGAARGDAAWMALARPAAVAQLFLVVFAFCALTQAYVTSDFSVLNVVQNSHSAKPLLYKITGVWGNHEGSMLLWILILALFGSAVAVFGGNLPPSLRARVLGVQAWIGIGFMTFTLFTSNPFTRIFPAPLDGEDLNPLLQDPGLAFHPPMLYAGYVGFSMAFSFAIAALIEGKVDAAWARWVRPWTLLAWAFLTGGIALGSWWAYYELGWGGWWFWDPVENASFMPWLVGTALMHSLAVTEKRGAFKAWTVLLAIFTFSLSLLGTFLVRSGVLTSVHAFATDPTRGVFILLFLGVVVGGSLLLYSVRAHQIRSQVHFKLVSRETGLLLNNVLLVVAAVSVLLGTLYPLLMDALNLGKISVGPPYFNSVFIPLTAPLAALVGLGALARWKQDSFQRIWPKVRIPLVVSLVLGVAFVGLAMPTFMWQAAVGMVLAVWVVATTFVALKEKLENRGSLWRGLRSIPRGQYGMIVGHLGLAVFVVGITLTSLYSVEKDVSLAPGESYEMAGFRFTFQGVREFDGPNYQATGGVVEVTRDGDPVASMLPEKRIYRVQQNPMTEAAIDAGVTRDLFVALGEPLGGGAWALRLYHKPFIRWIWMGALIMAIGGLLGASDRRYRQTARRTAPAQSRGAAVGTA
jgi:cytochrome c-type biogenesis protein CcmF